MDEIPNCSYYGSLKGELLGENASVFAVGAAFNGLLEKYEQRLEATQAKMITNLKDSFAKSLKEFRDSVKNIYLKINESEKEHAKTFKELFSKVESLDKKKMNKLRLRETLRDPKEMLEKKE